MNRAIVYLPLIIFIALAGYVGFLLVSLEVVYLGKDEIGLRRNLETWSVYNYDITLSIPISNPSYCDITVSKSYLTVYIENQPLGNINLVTGLMNPGTSHTFVGDLYLSENYLGTNLVNLLNSIFNGERVDMRVVGTITIMSGGISRDIEVNDIYTWGD